MRRILALDEEKADLEFLSKHLSEDGHTLQSAMDPDVALHRLKAWKPHVVLLNVDMPRANGFSLVPKIRMLTQEEYTAIILTSANASPALIKDGLQGGADDFLLKPFHVNEVTCSIRSMLKLKEAQDALKRANHRIEELVSSDELTSLMNMRAVYRKGEEEIARSRKFRKPVSCLLINMDEFSSVNQSYGFIVGSHVLQEAAARIKQTLRSIDLVARVGADEFFVLLTETDLAGAETMAERIRDAIQSTPFKNEKRAIKLTATIGVAGLTPDQTHQRMSDLIHIASEALKSAKANGVNLIEVYSFT